MKQIFDAKRGASVLRYKDYFSISFSNNIFSDFCGEIALSVKQYLECELRSIQAEWVDNKRFELNLIPTSG